MKIIEKTLSRPTLPAILTRSPLIVFDIETTGFSREFNEVILLGVIVVTDKRCQFTQWFNDDGSSEKKILKRWCEFMADYPDACVVTYNGDAFDLPFVHARCDRFGIKSPLFKGQSFDLYRSVRRRYKNLKGVENYKLKSIEKYLGIHREDQISGKESIDLYHEYLDTGSKELERQILLHNDEDIRLMLPLMEIINHIDISMDFPIQLKFDRWIYHLKFKALTKDCLTFTGAFDQQMNLNINRGAFKWSIDDKEISVNIPIIHYQDFIIANTQSIDGKAFNSLRAEDKRLAMLGKNEHLHLENIRTLILRMMNSVKEE